MQGNAAEPIKHTVRHSLEPWFQRVLEIIYKHTLQFFLTLLLIGFWGRKKQNYGKRKTEKKIKKEDIKLTGNPDFKPRGVSIFNENKLKLKIYLIS